MPNRLPVVLVAWFTVGCDAGPMPVPPRVDGGCDHDFIAALGRQDDATVMDLASRGARVSCDESIRRLEDAISNNQIDRVRVLLQAGVDPNRGRGELFSRPQTLQLAMDGILSGGNSLDVLGLLLDHHTNPDQRGMMKGVGYDEYERTPLIAAIVTRRADVADLLLRRGANPSLRDEGGRSALDYARQIGDEKMLKLFEQTVR